MSREQRLEAALRRMIDGVTPWPWFNRLADEGRAVLGEQEATPPGECPYPGCTGPGSHLGCALPFPAAAPQGEAEPWEDDAIDMRCEGGFGDVDDAVHRRYGCPATAVTRLAPQGEGNTDGLG